MPTQVQTLCETQMELWFSRVRSTVLHTSVEAAECIPVGGGGSASCSCKGQLTERVPSCLQCVPFNSTCYMRCIGFMFLQSGQSCISSLQIASTIVQVLRTLTGLQVPLESSSQEVPSTCSIRHHADTKVVAIAGARCRSRLLDFQ